MNNTTIINIFNSDNSSIPHTRTQNCPNMATIAYRFLKLESMINKPIVRNYAFFNAITFSRFSSFPYISYNLIQHLKDLIFIGFKKIVIKMICHLLVYNFSIACFACNIWISNIIKESIEMTVKDPHYMFTSGVFKLRRLV